MMVSATRDGDVIVLRIEQVPAVQAPDELIAYPYGLEKAAAARVMRTGDLKAARIGRRCYARRSDVLALVDRLAEDPPPKTTGKNAAADYSALVATARTRR